MKQVENFKVILWDFDGVILDSMAVRDLGFVRVLEGEGYNAEQINRLLAYHRVNGGLSRYVKFRYFYEEILGQSVSEEEVLRLADSFSKIMLSLLIDENLLIQDSVHFIKEKYPHYNFHIVSGSDGIELNQICAGLGLSSYFNSIQGSPTPKKQLVKDLLETYNYNPASVCLIGDSINDWEAATVNSIDFFGYNNEELRSEYEYIDSFSNLV